jgi:hypothetical protein
MNRHILLAYFVLATFHSSSGQVSVRDDKDTTLVHRYLRFLKPANQFENDYSIPFRQSYQGNLHFHFMPLANDARLLPYRTPSLGEAKCIGGMQRGVPYADYSRRYDFIFQMDDRQRAGTNF